LKYSWIILIGAWLLGFFMWSSVSALSPVLLEIKEELALTFAEIGFLFSLPLLMFAVFAIPGGTLADRIGVRTAAGIAAILLGLGSFLRGYALNFQTLLLFTCMLGIGWGLGAPNLPKIVSLWFPRSFSGRATGIYGTGIVSGVALALAVTPTLIHPYTGSWRLTLQLWGMMALIAACFWWAVVREPKKETYGNFEKASIKTF
jgi:CP family cyanate transporter-like MFS transporter